MNIFILNIYFVILKNMLNISNFHGKALREKNIFSIFCLFVFVKYLVKSRNLKKGIARMQRDLLFELLVLSKLKEAFGQTVHCLLLVPKALPGEIDTPGVSSYSLGGSWWK